MASIIGEYRNADGPEGNGWNVADKVFGYLDKAGNLYNELRYPRVPSPGDPNYAQYLDYQRRMQMGMFGIPNPWGAVILIGGLGLLAFGIYKLAK